MSSQRNRSVPPYLTRAKQTIIELTDAIETLNSRPASRPNSRRAELERVIFADAPDVRFRAVISGKFGAHKPRCGGLDIDQAVELFWRLNASQLDGTSMDTDAGREYVRLRIAEWY